MEGAVARAAEWYYLRRTRWGTVGTAHITPPLPNTKKASPFGLAFFVSGSVSKIASEGLVTGTVRLLKINPHRSITQKLSEKGGLGSSRGAPMRELREQRQ